MAREQCPKIDTDVEFMEHRELDREHLVLLPRRGSIRDIDVVGTAPSRRSLLVTKTASCSWFRHGADTFSSSV